MKYKLKRKIKEMKNISNKISCWWNCHAWEDVSKVGIHSADGVICLRCNCYEI